MGVCENLCCGGQAIYSTKATSTADLAPEVDAKAESDMDIFFAFVDLISGFGFYQIPHLIFSTVMPFHYGAEANIIWLRQFVNAFEKVITDSPIESMLASAHKDIEMLRGLDQTDLKRREHPLFHVAWKRFNNSHSLITRDPWDPAMCASDAVTMLFYGCAMVTLRTVINENAEVA